MRPLFLLPCVLLALAVPLGAVAAPAEPPPVPATTPAWAAAEIKVLVARGGLAASVETFRPDDPLTRTELFQALSALGLPAVVPRDPEHLVSLTELDATVVRALGATQAANAIRLVLRDAGLQPRTYAGTETVARVLGLRTNHPQGEEHLELGPAEPATRAEVAYSLVRALGVTTEQKAELVRLARGFALPRLDTVQTAVLRRALRFIGYPYVWAGTSESPQALATGIAPGGFDCSGLVWRVYKTQPFPELPLLGGTLKGRTTFSLAAERPRSERLPLATAQPGDLLFFGTRGPASTPQDIGHMGIALAPGWFLHSSGNGVTLQPLRGWYVNRFAWARSPIREAGLA